MIQQKEKFRVEIIIAIIQTLIFGIILAIVGTLLEIKLEDHKSKLSIELEMIKSTIVYNDTIIKQRIEAYNKIMLALQKFHNDLRTFYNISEIEYYNDTYNEEILDTINKLRGIEKFGTTGKWLTNSDVANSLENFVNVYYYYKSICSKDIIMNVDKYISIVVKELNFTLNTKNEKTSFNTKAVINLTNSYKELDTAIRKALNFDNMPIK